MDFYGNGAPNPYAGPGSMMMPPPPPHGGMPSGPAVLVEIIRPTVGDGDLPPPRQKERNITPRREPTGPGFVDGPARLVHIFRPGKVEVVPAPVPAPEPEPVPEPVRDVYVEPPKEEPLQPREWMLGGGPFHTNMMSIEGLVPEGSNPKVQWYRADIEEEYYPIVGATGTTYWPTADDLHSNVRVDFETAEGVRQIEADPACLTIDPLIARAVEENIERRSASWDVKQRLYDGRLEDRKLIVNENDCVIMKGDRVKLKSKLHPAMFVNLSTWESNVFDIEFCDASRNRPIFVCENIRQRDEIALTFRSFASTHSVVTGQVALHRVQPLSDLRHHDRMDHRDYEQAMLSV